MTQQDNDKKKKANDFIRYSNIAFQMVATILLAVFGGLKLDQWLQPSFPVFTVSLTILGVVAAIYSAIKDFL